MLPSGSITLRCQPGRLFCYRTGAKIHCSRAGANALAALCEMWHAPDREQIMTNHRKKVPPPSTAPAEAERIRPMLMLRNLAAHGYGSSIPGHIAQAMIDALPQGATSFEPPSDRRVAINQPPVTGGPTIAAVKDIGNLVREARRSRNLSQQAFADLAGVGRRFLSELENGKATLEFDKVLQVATAAGIDLLARKRG